MRINLILLVLVTVLFGKNKSEDVSFGNDLILITSDDTEASVQDNKDTGSYLFKIENELEKQDSISLNIRIGDLMTSTSPYLRAHPASVKCWQKIINYVQNSNDGWQVNVESSYKTQNDIGSKIQDVYAAAGTAAVLGVTDATTGATIQSTDALPKLAEAALLFCPTIFASERQYLGVVMQSNTVHVHMTGSSDTREHYFAVDGYTGQTTSDFVTWAKAKLNDALDPVVGPDCSAFSAVSTVWPSGVSSPDQAVGSPDSDINDKVDYMSRLVLYPGDLDYTGEPLMSPRMFEVIRKLQYLVKQNSSNNEKLKIEKLFAEEANSLHLEGRQASLSAGSDVALLSIFARCVGADYVKIEGSKVVIAVKKQSAINANRVKFPQGELLEVTPPKAILDTLGNDVDTPVFDTPFQMDKYVSELSQLKDYVSSASRYIRVHPAIVQCYDNLLRHEKKWNDGVDVSIPIIQSYLPMDELLKLFDPEQDPRGRAFAEGKALLLNYGTSLDTSKYDIHRIVSSAIHKCGPVFDELKMAIGIGIYDEGVYIGITESFLLWFGDTIVLPPGVEQGQYVNQMEELYENAIIGRVVDPEDPATACETEVIPEPQSHDYKYQPKTQAASADENCKVERNTKFCNDSQTHRKNQIDHLWAQFSRLHMPSEQYRISLKKALEGCFGTCGTCLLGEVYEEKVEHCSNLLHWLNFRLLNDAPNITNFFHTKNFDTRKEACVGADRHCVVNSPLYAILASSVFELFRPDSTRSIEEELYGATDNPSPVPELLYELYAKSASGTITVWVKDDEELKFLRRPLKAAMLYNKNVTTVDVKVVKPESVADVNIALEGMIATWVTTGCRTHSREVIAPYTVSSLPEGHVKKRDTKQYEHFSFGEQLLLKRKHFEYHWAQSVRK